MKSANSVKSARSNCSRSESEEPFAAAAAAADELFDDIPSRRLPLLLLPTPCTVRTEHGDAPPGGDPF